MADALLITQCLQMDFVGPIGRHEPLPNLLHIGHDEARRLMGEKADEGPVARTLDWAYHQSHESLALIHIRDWHDRNDPSQAEHMDQFGSHCLRGTPGAAFAFAVPSDSGGRAETVDSLTLNDFIGTNLSELLTPLAGGPLRVGLMGVWTEAKISFLAYELRTRYPGFDIAVCSALTASSSRARHFLALEQLDRLLGVRILDSIAGFVEFLSGGRADTVLPPLHFGDHPEISFADGQMPGDTDVKLLRYLFRDCRSATFRRLDGGFSGNLVAGSTSVDLFGHPQVPHVVKIGPSEPIGRERTAFESIEAVLGNNAPRVADFADLDGRGAIKYRYASMGGGLSSTFQKLYQRGMPLDRVRSILDTVFLEQLGRFHAAATFESADLLTLYGFEARWAPGVRARVEALTGTPADGETLTLGDGITVANPCLFYERDLARLAERGSDGTHFSHVHGDLNGANIIVDGGGNVWLIDFFHTRRTHALMDLIKLENDVLYIMTDIEPPELGEAVAMSRHLVAVEDLAAPLPDWPDLGLSSPRLERAWATVRHLRSYYPAIVRFDRDPLQVLVGTMRYAVHTLSFDESSDLQKRWALATAGLCAERIVAHFERVGPLRVDWIADGLVAPGRLGLSILPGRRDLGRSLEADLASLIRTGITDVVMLVTADELQDYGVPGLRAAYQAAGLGLHWLPIPDQGVGEPDDVRTLVTWIEARLHENAHVLVHCLGGVGRSGMVAACLLRTRGLSGDAAITEVRRARSPRAVETAVQEAFVQAFQADTARLRLSVDSCRVWPGKFVLA
ncbi:MAG: isochorismatase family protein [Alphaproteobacteria bacterium]